MTAPPLARHPSLDDRRDPAVRIVEHDPAWSAQATVELERVAAALGPLATRLEHTGSTAVPGLASKPIIDLLVAVAAIEPSDAYAVPLQPLGYLYAPDPASPQRRFFGRPPERPRTHHVHVVGAGGDEERRHLAVRDYLRAHDGEAARYAALKRELVARAPGDRLAYVDGKSGFMTALEARALRWAGGTTAAGR